MTIPEKVRFIRKQMKLTQPELASRIRSSKQIIVNIETGKTPAPDEFLLAFSEFTKIPLSKIKTGNIGMNDIVFTKENEPDLGPVLMEGGFDYEIRSKAENPAKDMMMQMMMENNAILKEQNEFLKLEIKRLNDQIELMKRGKI